MRRRWAGIEAQVRGTRWEWQDVGQKEKSLRISSGQVNNNSKGKMEVWLKRWTEAE